MQMEKNVALFVDVDNCGLTLDTFNNAIAEAKERGNLVYGKVYGLSDRKHGAIINVATNLGFDTATVMRNKKRGRKDFDARMIVDVLDTVFSYDHIDTVCIVSAPFDMVYLYSKLHLLGVNVVALDNGDEDCLALIDDVLDIGLVETLKPIAAPKQQEVAVTKAVEAVDSAPVEETVATEESFKEPEYSPEDEKLLGEIKKLLADYNNETENK